MAASGILIIPEIVRGQLSITSRETLALGRAVADGLGERVTALVAGANAEVCARSAIAYGADTALFCDDPSLAHYQPEAVQALAESTCRAVQPRAVVLPHSPMGCDLAPRIAHRLGASWASGCIALRIENGEVAHTRLAYGGKVMLDEAWEASPAVVTWRPKSREVPKGDPARRGKVERVAKTDAGELRLRAVDWVDRGAGAKEKLEQAEVIACGGRGMGSAQAFEMLQKVADLLGGTVGASKAAVDMDWVPADMQVGMTGTTVAPRLYLAVGISGATQHLAGCSKSKVIVAVNKDPKAPIFHFAQYGIVGEWQKVLPPLLRCLEEAR